VAEALLLMLEEFRGALACESGPAARSWPSEFGEQVLSGLADLARKLRLPHHPGSQAQKRPH